MADKKRNSKVVCTGYALTETKNGFPQMCIDLRIVEGERTGEDMTFYRVVKTEDQESIDKAVGILKALGYNGGSIASPEGLGRLKANCLEVEDTYNGKTRWKVVWVSSPSGRKNSISDDVADKFAAVMDAALANTEPLEETVDNAAPETLPEAVHHEAPAQSTSPEDVFA